MKNLFILFFLNLTLATASDCWIVGENQKNLKQAIKNKSNDYFVCNPAETLIGELDPYVLGDGALIALNCIAGNTFVIYEPNEEAPIASALESAKNEGKNAVAVNLKCLKDVKTNSRKGKEMIELSRRHMNCSQEISLFEVR